MNLFEPILDHKWIKKKKKKKTDLIKKKLNPTEFQNELSNIMSRLVALSCWVGDIFI